VDGLEGRRQLAQLLETLLGPLDAGIALVARLLRRGAGVIHLPGERRAMGRVLGEQPVEQGGAGAGKPKYEEGLVDLLLRHLGVARAVVLQRESVAEQLQHLAPCEIAPKGIELGILLQRPEEPGEAGTEGRGSKIREARHAPGAREQVLLVQRETPGTHPGQPTPQSVHDPQGGRSEGRRERPIGPVSGARGHSADSNGSSPHRSGPPASKLGEPEETWREDPRQWTNG
jgi:hypothetical protein